MNNKIYSIIKIIPIVVLSVLLFKCNSVKTDTINVTGVVNGDIITIKAKASGTVTSLSFSEGKKVSENDILLKIDSRMIFNKIEAINLNLKTVDIKIAEIKNSIKYILSNKKYIAKQVKRFKRLFRNNSISGEKLENMQLKLTKINTEFYTLQKKIESLKIEKEKLANSRENLNLILENHTVFSPVNGIIIEKFVSKGENILPSQPIADILDENTLYIEIFIEGEEIAKLKLGERVKIHLDGLEEEQSGTISYFGKKAEFSPKYVVSEKERKALLYLVKVKIDKNKRYFKLGMPLTVTFDKKNKK